MNGLSTIVLSAEQVRQWDQYTIEKEGITSLELMEKASNACFRWLVENNYGNRSFSIFCGKGNNGGDGLALARMLSVSGVRVSVYVLETNGNVTGDFQANLSHLSNTTANISIIGSEQNLHPVNKEDIVIDALFGSGLNRPLNGLAELLVKHINNSGNEIISVDMPSGLFTDKSSKGNTSIKATHTLSFEAFKPAFLVSENAEYTGNIHLLRIGLSADFPGVYHPLYWLTDISIVKSSYRRRNNFSHKGTYGHAALLAGSEHMMGAAVLCARACLRSGVGKLTCYVPTHGNLIMQLAVPEAMTATLLSATDIQEASYDAIGIGPGLGKYDSNVSLLAAVFTAGKPVVVDADALNTIAAAGEELLDVIPPLSILTPHPKEFDRIFGEPGNDFERIKRAEEQAANRKIIIVLKGHYTFIAMPEGHSFFNTTGNPGMATAGSGDVLTGIITGLLAQKYHPLQAALTGVFLHGLAGDLAAEQIGQEALIASDIINFLGKAFLTLSPPALPAVSTSYPL